MFLAKALGKAFIKSFEIESRALQMALVNSMVKRFSNFIKIYWILLIIGNIFGNQRSHFYNNIFSNFKMKINTQTLTNIQICIDLPFLNDLKIQINIKNENKNQHSLILSKEIINTLNSNFKFITFNKTGKK